MDFQTAVRTCLQKYVTFEGRATRPEYWWFVLFSVGVVLVLGILGGLFGAVLLMVLGLALLPPGVAAAARRLHDTGRSGWWQLGPAVPNLLGELVGSDSLFGILLGNRGIGVQPGADLVAGQPRRPGGQCLWPAARDPDLGHAAAARRNRRWKLAVVTAASRAGSRPRTSASTRAVCATCAGSQRLPRSGTGAR